MFESRAANANQRARQLGYISNLHAGELEYVYALFDKQCAYCQEHLTNDTLEFDHPIALSGNRDSWEIFPEIVVPCCKTCNREKSTKNYDEFIEESHPNFMKITMLIDFH